MGEISNRPLVGRLTESYGIQELGAASGAGRRIKVVLIDCHQKSIVKVNWS